VQERGAVPPVATAPAHRRHLLLAGAVAVAVVVADQITKTLAVDHLSDGPVHLFWTLRFNLSFNSGAAFGLGRGVTPIILGLGVVMLVVLLGLGRMAAVHVAAAIALGLLIGGAAGNLFDRVFRHNGGSVIDFIDFQWWPIFNVADTAISCGAVLLVLVSRHKE